MGGVFGKSACEVACHVAGWAGLGLVLGKGGGRGGWGKCLEILMAGGGWEKCLQGCMRGCRLGQAGIGAWKLPRADAQKNCSGWSYQDIHQQLLGKVVPTIPRHTITWKRLLSPWANLKRRLGIPEQTCSNSPNQIYVSRVAYLLHVLSC